MLCINKIQRCLPLTILVSGFVLFAIVSLTLPPNKVHALSGSNFNPGRIIDDAVFENNNAMSVQDIQSFLNTKVGTCDNSGTELTDRWDSSTGSYYTDGQWAALHGQSSTFTCINQYIENPTTLQNNFGNYQEVVPGGISAAQIIYNAAQEYQINPEVILVTLQKEQGLVTDYWPWYSEYQYAMGYACPDSGSCSSSDADFYEQVTNAAWQFRQYYTNPDNYNYTTGNNYILYNPSTSCGGSIVDIQDQATADLYDYTPYQPDAAALANVSGTSDGGTGNSCSAYGNRNFWWYFTAWFGSTTYNEPPNSLIIFGNQSGKLYFVSLENNTMYYIPTWSTFLAYGLNRYVIMFMNDDLFDNSYTNGGTLKTVVFNNDDQRVYFVDGGNKYWFATECSNWGLDCLNQTAGDVSFLNSSYFDNDVTTEPEQPIQWVNGIYYLMQTGDKLPYLNLTAMQKAGYSTSQAISIQQPDINSTQPLGPLIMSSPGFVQFSPNTQLLFFDGKTYHYISNYSIYQAWGTQPLIFPPTSSYNTALPTLGSNLSVWAQDTKGQDYLIDSGRKINITPEASSWYNGSYQVYSDNLFNQLPAVTVQAPYININGDIYVLQNATKRHIPSWADYVGLGITPSQTLALSNYSGSIIPTGQDMLASGSPFTVVGNANLYIVNNGASIYVPSWTLLMDFGYNYSNIDLGLASNDLSAYVPSANNLSRLVQIGNGNLYYVVSGSSLAISSSVAQAWGFTNSDFTLVDPSLLSHTVPKALGLFVNDVATGCVYYGAGGTYHYIASYSTFVSMGGLKSPLVNVYPDFLSNLAQGSTYN
jgi:hypothetical protein